MADGKNPASVKLDQLADEPVLPAYWQNFLKARVCRA
jgi:hypothetical protein